MTDLVPDNAIAETGATGTRHSWWTTNLALAGICLVACAPLFISVEHYGRLDWDINFFMNEVPRLALLRDHQLPLWNPYVNGGTVLLAHPESPATSPWYAIVLLLGTTYGLRVQVVVFMILGATGIVALLRHWKVSPGGQFLAGTIYALNSHFLLHIAAGNVQWCAMGLMPWLMLFTIHSVRDLRWAVAAAAVFASVLTFGVTSTPAVFVPFLTCWATLESLRLRSARLLVTWLAILALSIPLSAIKLLPVMDFLADHPRQTQTEGFEPRGLLDVYLNPRQAFLYRSTIEANLPPEYRSMRLQPVETSRAEIARLKELGFRWQWMEYGSYVTWLGVAFALLGIVAVPWRLWPLAVAGLLALGTSMGSGGPIDLWGILRMLPVYDSLRVPSRFSAAVVFTLAVSAGIGFHWCSRKLRANGRLRMESLIWWNTPLLVTIELLVMSWALFSDVFVIPPLPTTHYPNFATRHRFNENYAFLMGSCLTRRLRSNSGVLKGYEIIAVKRGDIRIEARPDYLGEAYLASREPDVKITKWTTGAQTIEIEVDQPDRLFLNQNGAKGWTAEITGPDGVRTENAWGHESGLISVPVRPGDRRVRFRYFPQSVRRGITITLATLACCMLYLLPASWSPRLRFGSAHDEPPEIE